MMDHLKKHNIYRTPGLGPALSQQSTIEEMFEWLVATRNQEPLMSLEQALIEWIIDTLQPFVVVEKPSFWRVFECIQHKLPLQTRDTI
jgi:hypothetical protein